MIKKFTLSVMLLLSMAVGTSYADEDPSVVTLFEYSFADGMGVFTSLSSLGNEGVANNAWHYNEELHCVECSGDEMGFLISPIFAGEYGKNYSGFTLTIEHAGSGIYSSYDIDLRVGLHTSFNNETTWSYYRIGDSFHQYNPITIPNSPLDFTSSGNLPLDNFTSGAQTTIAIGFTPSDGKIYRIKNFKVTARDWSLIPGITEISNMSQLLDLEDGTPVKITVSQAKCVYEDENNHYFCDNTGGVQTPRYNYVCYWGGKYGGLIYGYYDRFQGMPRLTNVKYVFNQTTGLSEQERAPLSIGEDEYWDNVMNYVTMPITSEIHVWDKDNYLENSYINRDYVPNYQTTFTGLLVPTENGEKRFLMTNKKSILITLPEIMETSLSDNEIDFWGKINRQFESDKWYTLCLPFLPEYGTGSWETTIAHFSSAENGELSFFTSGSWENNKPCLIKFVGDRSTLEGKIYFTEPGIISSGDYTFAGTLKTVTPTTGCYYLTAGNTIRPLAPGGKINAFRAYFEPNTPSAARTRSISIDGTVIATGDGSTTDIEDILNGRTNDVNGEVYNLNGQRVTNSTKKGIYIINGKKVIK